jgi:hypothetical protein
VIHFRSQKSSDKLDDEEANGFAQVAINVILPFEGER